MRLSAWQLKLALNIWPPYWGTGIWVESIAKDFSHVRVGMRHAWYNRNLVGVHFGGSLFAMADPFPMLQVLYHLGKDHYVWDINARIDFIAPGRTKVFAEFPVSAEQIAQIRLAAEPGAKIFVPFEFSVVDREGTPIAKIVKEIYIKRKPQK